MNEDTDILTKNVTITVAEAAVPTYTLTLTEITDLRSGCRSTGSISITITVNPAAGKQVFIHVNGVNKKTELMADPAHQYGFSIIENTRCVTYEDIPADEFTLSLFVSPSGGGLTSINGTQSTSDTFPAGTAVAVGCMPLGGYAFVNWTIEGSQVSTQENFTYIMPSNDIELTANFITTAAETPPDLTADTTGNRAGANLMITFSDGAAWASEITEIQAEGQVISNEAYVLSPGAVGVEGSITL